MGYGSAKTTTGAAEIIRHILQTPRGATLIGAATLPQLEQTAQLEFFKMFPEQLIEHYNKQKNYIDCINGHRVIFRPLDDPGKARSLNLTAFWIEEASEVDYEYFVQLQTRLRNAATENHIGIITTNPDLNWIRTEFLLKSHRIENAAETYNVTEINESMSTHIAPTELNIHLPPTYREDTARGKPAWWIARYLDGSFSHAEGMVYPDWEEHLVDPFEIPDHWKRLAAADFGLRDPTVMLFGAIDPKSGIVYIYDEHYEAEKDVAYHASKMNERLLSMKPGILQSLVGDPKGNSRSERDLRSLFDHYAEYGIYFQEASNRIEDGIMKVYTYFRLGKLKIFHNLHNTVWEGRNYKYPERKLGEVKAASEKPVDKDNHAMDAIRYLIMELPDDPSYLSNESLGMTSQTWTNDQKHLPYALRDDSDSYARDWYNGYW